MNDLPDLTPDGLPDLAPMADGALIRRACTLTDLGWRVTHLVAQYHYPCGRLARLLALGVRLDAAQRAVRAELVRRGIIMEPKVEEW